MNTEKNRNLAASIRQRLLNHAQRVGEEFQVTLNNFLLERFLYRLGRSPVKSRFVLKGALLFRVWADTPYRATLDLDLPAPHVLAYHPATVIAEKLEALIVLGLTNSRIKDYFDLHYLASNFPFEGETLVRAIEATFVRRTTPFPVSVLEGLTDEYWDHQGREAHLRAFARRARVSTSVPEPRAV